MHISAAEIESPDVLDVTTTTDEPWLAEYRDAENETTYEVTSTRSINGSDSTIEYLASDDGVSKRLTPRPKTPSRATSSTTSRCRTMRVSP